MFKRHKAAILVFMFLIMIIVISGINLYFLLENINTREDRVRRSVEKVLESAEMQKALAPAQPIIIDNTPVKGVDYFDGKDGRNGANGSDGKSVKGNDGAPGKDGVNGKDGSNGSNGIDGLTLEIRCNTKKNRWETKYVNDTLWRVMNNEVVRCTTDEE